MNDAKFISGGRILELHEIIQPDILKEIQEQLFYILFPHKVKCDLFHYSLNHILYL